MMINLQVIGRAMKASSLLSSPVVQEFEDASPADAILQANTAESDEGLTFYGCSDETWWSRFMAKSIGEA